VWDITPCSPLKVNGVIFLALFITTAVRTSNPTQFKASCYQENGSSTRKPRITFFWVLTPCNSKETRRFGGTCPVHLQSRRVSRTQLATWLLPLFCLVYSILNMEAICSFETSFFLTTCRCYPEERTFRSHRYENPKFYRRIISDLFSSCHFICHGDLWMFGDFVLEQTVE
jgi:hypothetical protein